jgi:hypothetical protein
VSTPSREQAAAAIAAIERFLEETARREGRPPRDGDRWTAAGRLEVAQPPSPWGPAHPWLKY